MERGIHSAETLVQLGRLDCPERLGVFTTLRTEVRDRALEKERAQEGESPSVAELPARNGK